MSTIDMTVISGSLQTLVDARLDAIDRALLGRVSRQERLNVGGEVVGGIHVLLHDRCGPGVEPSRDDVLAVLAQLDPPEAYLADGDDEEPRAARTPSRTPAPAAAWPASDPGRLAWHSGVLGLAALGSGLLVPLSYPIAILLDNEFPVLAALFGGGLFMMFGGFASVLLAMVSRLSNGWAVVGVVAGGLSFLLALGYAVLLLLGSMF
jgi:hypothetical protein